MAERAFPVQINRSYPSLSGEVSESVYMAAYEVYSHVYGPQEAMVDLEKGCRGGFCLGEMAAFLYARSFPRSEWRQRVDAAFEGMKI